MAVIQNNSSLLLYDPMTTTEVAAQLVALGREGRFLDAVKTLYAEDIVSVDAADYQGLGREMHGKEAVLGKNVAWFNDNEVHSASVTGPFVSPEKFALWYSFEWTRRASGERVQFTEVAVYSVADGKIAHESSCTPPDRFAGLDSGDETRRYVEMSLRPGAPVRLSLNGREADPHKPDH